MVLNHQVPETEHKGKTLVDNKQDPVCSEGTTF